MERRNWQRNELLLALNLYCKLPFGQYHNRNPEIIKLARFINRTPDALAMKLSNFASMDPYHIQRGITGLSNSSKADREIWEEFHNNWNTLAIESELAFQTMADPSSIVPEVDLGKVASPTAPTEIERQVKARVGQAFFRTVILTSYHQKCCVCQLPIPDMLIASHIIPWHQSVEYRLNPHNGLCLCALHDRGFDRGFVTIGENYELIMGKEIRQYLPNEAIQMYFSSYHGKPISLPDKFIPDQNLLEVHRQSYFKG